MDSESLAQESRVSDTNGGRGDLLVDELARVRPVVHTEAANLLSEEATPKEIRGQVLRSLFDQVPLFSLPDVLELSVTVQPPGRRDRDVDAQITLLLNQICESVSEW